MRKHVVAAAVVATAVIVGGAAYASQESGSEMAVYGCAHDSGHVWGFWWQNPPDCGAGATPFSWRAEAAALPADGGSPPGDQSGTATTNPGPPTTSGGQTTSGQTTTTTAASNNSVERNRVYRPGDLPAGRWSAEVPANCLVRLIDASGLEQAKRPAGGEIRFDLGDDDRVVFGPGCPTAWTVT